MGLNIGTLKKPITEEDYLFLFSQPVPKQLISLPYIAGHSL